MSCLRLSIAIILLVTLSFQINAHLCTILTFNLQQEYIAKNLCVNREVVASTCEGHCYLTTKLQENTKQEQKSANVKVREAQPYCISNLVASPLSYGTLTKKVYRSPVDALLPTDEFDLIDHPPEC